MTTLREKKKQMDGIQWTGANQSEIASFLDSLGVLYHFEIEDTDLFVVQRDRTFKVSLNSWITSDGSVLFAESNEDIIAKYDII